MGFGLWFRAFSLARFEFEFRLDLAHRLALPELRQIFHRGEGSRPHAVNVERAVEVIDLVL